MYTRTHDIVSMSLEGMHRWTWTHIILMPYNAYTLHVSMHVLTSRIGLRTWVLCLLIALFIAMFSALVSHLTTNTHTESIYPFQFDDCYFYHDLVCFRLLLSTLSPSMFLLHLASVRCFFVTQREEFRTLYHLISSLCHYRNMSSVYTQDKTIHILLATQCSFSAFLCAL